MGSTVLSFNDIKHNDIQHNLAQHKGLVCDIEHNNDLHCAECHNAKCRIIFIVMWGVIVLSVIMLIVVAPFHGL